MKWTLDLGNALQKVQIPIGGVTAYEMSESNYGKMTTPSVDNLSEF